MTVMRCALGGSGVPGEPTAGRDAVMAREPADQDFGLDRLIVAALARIPTAAGSRADQRPRSQLPARHQRLTSQPASNGQARYHRDHLPAAERGRRGGDVEER